MNVRAHIATDPAVTPRPSARVARVAELLDCDERKVRRLIDLGELETHGLGVRGLRVFLDSIADYQAGRPRPIKNAIAKSAKPRAIDRAAQTFAELELRKSGILE